MAISKISWRLPPSKLKLSINDIHVWRVRLNQAIGNGLYHALDRFDVSLVPGEPARLVSVEGSAELASGWFLKALTPEEGYVAARAVKGSDFCPSYWQVSGKKINSFLKRFSLFGKLDPFGIQISKSC